jgi:hypothetical protein
MVKELIPAPAARQRQIRQVIVRGSRVVIILQEEGGQAVMTMIEVDGVWKVD